MKTLFPYKLLGLFLLVFIGSVFFGLPVATFAQYSYNYADPYYQPQTNPYYEPQTNSYYQSPYGYGNVLGASTASVRCEFQRNLTIGFGGEDVRCLQQYLNTSGFTVASFGAGSPGNETTYFGARTASALSVWQSAQGIFPASGYFGDLSRAKYNALMASPGQVLGAYSDQYSYSYPYSTSPYSYVQAPAYTPPNYYYYPMNPAPWYGGSEIGGILVSPGPQPASSIAPQGTRVPFTRIQLSANPYRDITINSITVERRGFSSDAAFDSISLLDENNAEIGRSRTLNSNHQVIFSDSFVIRAGTTKTITVAGNMASNLSSYAGQTASLAVISVYSPDAEVQGSLPIEGSQMTMNATYQVANVNVRVGSQGSFSATRDIGSEYGFSSFYLTAGSSDDIRLESVRWYQAGSASASDLSNVITTVDGVSYPTTVSSDGRYYTAQFGGGVYLSRGTTKEVIVRARIESGSGRTIKFDIEQATDIRVTSSSQSFGLIPLATSISSPSLLTAEFTSTIPFYDGAQITIGGSSFRVARASSIPSQFIGVGTPNQTFAAFEFSNGAGGVTIQRMVFDIEITRVSASSASVNDIRSITLADQNGFVLAGPFDAVGSGVNGTITFPNTVSIPAGTRDYYLKAQLGSDFREGDRITVSLEPEFDLVSVRSQTTGAFITATPAGTVTSFPMTVRGTTVAVSLGFSPVSQTVVAGAEDFTFATFVFDASYSGEDMRLNTMPVRFTASAYAERISGCQLFDGSISLNNGGNIVNPSSSSSGSDLQFFLDSGFIIQRGTIKSLSLRCDVSGSAVSGTTYRLGLETRPTLSGLQSGTTVTASVSPDLGPVMTVAGGGGFSVTLSPSSPSYKIAVSDSTEIAGMYTIRATSESIRLTYIRLKLSGTSADSSPADVREVTLWNDGTMVGQGIFAGVSRTVTIPLTGDFTVPNGSERNLTVRVRLSPIGINEPASEGALVQINYDGSVPTDTKATGISSGSLLTSSTATDTNVSGIRLFNTVPTFTKLNLDSTTLVNGENRFLRFAVAAHSAADVGLYKFTLRLAASSMSISQVNIYGYSDAGFSNPLNLASSDGRLLASGQTPDGANIVEVIAENSSGSANPIQVSGGATRYFEVRGIVTGVSSDSTLLVFLEGDSSYPALGALMGTAATIDSQSEDDFIWSPNARGTSATTDVDWTNGYALAGLPSAGILQVLSR